MTFNNACFFTAIAILLEDYDVYIEDKDIIKDSLIPYIFTEKDKLFESGYQIQDIDIINDYLKRYILKLEEVTFSNKEQLLKELINSKTKKIVPLLINNTVHSCVYLKYTNDLYYFLNMRRTTKEQETFIFTRDELLDRLSSNKRFAFLKRINTFETMNKNKIISTSLAVFNEYHNTILANMKLSLSYQERLQQRDTLYRALLLNYIDMASILNKEKLHHDLTILQQEYLHSFSYQEPIKLEDHMNIKRIQESLDAIKDLIILNKNISYYHGSRQEGLTILEPNMSIHEKEYVYLTTKKEVALIYTVNAIESYFESNNLQKPEQFHPWYSYGFDQGVLQIEEYYENAFKETYKGKKGIIYTCVEPVTYNNLTNIFCAITTIEHVKVLEEIHIDDVYEEFLRLEKRGQIKIRYYEELSDELKKNRIEGIKKSIEHFDLLNKPNHHYSIFLKAKFPDLF